MMHRLFLDATWNTCIICEMCVEQFLTNMMSIYKKNLLEADCRASQLRVLAQGPPIYIAVYKMLRRNHFLGRVCLYDSRR